MGLFSRLFGKIKDKESKKSITASEENSSEIQKQDIDGLNPDLIVTQGLANGFAIVHLTIGGIGGTDRFTGKKYIAKLPLDLPAAMLLNHIADEMGVVKGYHSGYILKSRSEPYFSLSAEDNTSTLRSVGVVHGAELEFIDWG